MSEIDSNPPIEPLQKPGMRRAGILFVISAPSGGGKSTLLSALRREPDFVYSVSCTTRKPRPGEVDGIDYHFLSRTEFESRIAAGDFLEYAEVYGNYYGTRRDAVLASLHEGIDVLIDIDVKGAGSIRSDRGLDRDLLVDIFLMPPSLETLKLRLQKRGTETEEQMETRMKSAIQEMQRWREYRYTIVSGTAEEDVRNFRAIMCAERQLTRRLSEFVL